MSFEYYFSFLTLLCTICAGTLANPEAPRAPTLMSTHWLNKYIKENPYPTQDIRVLEISFNSDPSVIYSTSYLSGHITTADYFDLYKCVHGYAQIYRNIPDRECFTEQVRRFGVWEDTYVIVYHKSQVYNAFRAWWIFRLFGHRNVSVLDGGYQKWQKDGYVTSTSLPLIQISNITLQLDSTLIRTYEEMLLNVETRAEQVIDGRSTRASWITGKAHSSQALPNAMEVPYSDLLHNDGTMKSYSKLIKIFEHAGVNISLPMVSYCNTGMKATVVAGAAHRLGKDIPVYNGSWSEWRVRAPKELT